MVSSTWQNILGYNSNCNQQEIYVKRIISWSAEYSSVILQNAFKVESWKFSPSPFSKILLLESKIFRKKLTNLSP